MNYNDAVAVYQKSPTSETLKEVCKQLCSEMTLREKLKMLSGSLLCEIAMTCLQRAESTTTDRALRAELSAWKSRRLPFRMVRAVLLWVKAPASPFQWREALHLTMSLNMRSAQPLQKK